MKDEKDCSVEDEKLTQQLVKVEARARAEVTQVAAVIVPFPAQGHLNQLLHLARLLAGRGLPVHFAASATHIRQAQLRVEGWDPLSSPDHHLHFHTLPLPQFPSPPPNPLSASKFPEHLLPSFCATSLLRAPLASLLLSLSHSYRRLAVIHDTLMPFASEVAAAVLPNAYSFHFHPSSAHCDFFMRHDFEQFLRCGVEPPSLQGCFTPGFWDFVGSLQASNPTPGSPSGHLHNTCRPIEAQYLDLVAEPDFHGPNTWAIGPLHPLHISSRSCHPCMDWLHERQPDSVIYVSFGTMSSISDAQVCELALGLERSGHPFLWVLREADRGDIFEAQDLNGEGGGEARNFVLPDGFEERTRPRGLVVRDWAPQIEILGHWAVGGFMTHCGWNSCIESMSMGVPMATWPMHSDQPSNAMLVTDVLKVGVTARVWERRAELATAEELGEVVRKLMGSEQGKEIRKRAKDLGVKVCEVWAEGGSSRADLDSFISFIKS